MSGIFPGAQCQAYFLVLKIVTMLIRMALTPLMGRKDADSVAAADLDDASLPDGVFAISCNHDNTFINTYK